MQVCESLLKEHEQIEEILNDLTNVMETITTPETLSTEKIAHLKTLSKAIEKHFKIHFACEEQGLFPVLSHYHPMDLMELEHETLISLKEGFDNFLHNDNLSSTYISSLCESAKTLTKEILDHVGRENVGIFPMAERDLSEAEKQYVVSKMDSIRKQADSLPAPQVPERHFQVAQFDLDTPPEKNVAIDAILSGEHFLVKEVTLRPNQSLGTHFTKEPAALICLEGEGFFLSDNNKIPLQKGSIVTLDRRLLHSVEAKTLCRFGLLKWVSPATVN